MLKTENNPQITVNHMNEWRRTALFVAISVLFVTISGAKAAEAASLYFSPATGSYPVGQTFSVSVYVSSPDQSMNAASGIISFPADRVEIISLSKSGSIFNLWVQEPSFSNTLGTVSFEGIVLNPGFIGSNGKIITLTLKTKTAGSALLSFSSSSVLANDGKGTNILTELGRANLFIGILPAEEPETTSGTPSAPEISSLTHPNPEQWYRYNKPKFSWWVPAEVNAVRLLYNRLPLSQPAVVYTPPIAEKELGELADGIWYFHAQFKNAAGWGKIAHFKFQIDTQPPKPFEIQLKESKITTNPQPTLSYETIDELSGIDHYEIIIDNQEPIKTERAELQIPYQQLGRHNLVVKALDRAGNETLTMTEIEILPIEAPIITDYPRRLAPDSILSVKGTAIPEAKIIISLRRDKEEARQEETRSDKEGNWLFIETEPLKEGPYEIWAEAIDNTGAKSRPSNKVTFSVESPAFIRIGQVAISYLTTIITLLALIFGLVAIIFRFLSLMRKKKRKLQTEVSEAERILYQAFKTLKEKIEEQVAALDKKPGLNEREKKLSEELKKALELSEKVISKEIEELEQEIK